MLERPYDFKRKKRGGKSLIEQIGNSISERERGGTRAEFIFR